MQDTQTRLPRGSGRFTTAAARGIDPSDDSDAERDDLVEDVEIELEDMPSRLRSQ